MQNENLDAIITEEKTTTTPSGDDEIHRCESGDLLNGVGSASSLASTVSSVFSNNQTTMSSYPGQTSSLHALTPLTNTDSSPPGKPLSPRSAKLSDDTMHATTTSPYTAPSADLSQNVSETMTPVHTPPEHGRQARPGPGEPKGFRLFYDPMLDPKLSQLSQSEQKKPKPRYKTFGEQDDPSPPPDPRLAIAGYTSGNYVIKTGSAVAPKTKLRMAPYTLKPYTFDPRISVGPGPATQVVVTGFDPLIQESQIKALFGSYGEIAELSNKTDPNTGSFLGVCLVKYRDSRPVRGGTPIKAADAAKRAEKEGNNQRIGLREVKVQLDREGRKCKRFIAAVVEQNRKEQEKLFATDAARKPGTPAAGLTPTAITFEPPPNAPKGPSGKGMRPPEGPRLAALPKPAAHALVENEPILDKIKRKPYIFIAHQYVPVLGTTIVHLQKRLKNYQWKEVRVDKTGYFIIFEDSKRGEDETVRCYKECHMTALFTYVMNMECQQYGNPNYERSPSPERVLAEKREKEEQERLIREEEMDLEYEKKRRAEDLDPVIAALEYLKTELRDKVMSDIKARIAGPALFDYLDPERHVAKRRRLNIPDPQSQDAVRPTTYFGRGDDTPSVGTPDSRAAGFSGRFRKPLGPYDHNMFRGRKMPKVVNAFQDERRRKLPPKRPVVRGLHRQMLDFYDDDKDSDDEGRSSFTRDTEEQESRPLSRAASTDLEDEELSIAHRSKRRRVDPGWGEDSDDEMMDDAHARGLLAHLIDKDPEDMAEKELEQVLAILPRSSPIWKKADRAMKRTIKLRRSIEEADAIFFGVNHETASVDRTEIPSVDITLEDDELAHKPVATTELEDIAKATSKKKLPKAKRKTKKQIFEEREALKAQTAATSEEVVEEEETPAAEEVKAEAKAKPEVFEPLPDTHRAEVEWGVSTDKPRRTVEDDIEIVLDIDGWQHMLKDEEDLKFLREALASEPASNVGDVHLWAWKQKQIKALNRPGEQGIIRSETKIEGYYVPNQTGCARTESVKKILELDKSKYLPHRIRVQKAREEREARAKNDPAAAAEAAKLAAAAKIASTTSSRSNRANNRRLVNDINTQKQTMSAEGDTMRFNQLKKRKKLVKFDRSAIHNWGLYAEENIAVNDMIIEYVGEKVRQRVADLREKKYDMQGVGSSYLFRIDEDTVIDATKMGGIARFINHSCTPNCTAKIIRVDGTKRIVIYALRDIAKNEELTYDYKFEREIDSTDRIPCLCGSVGCKGFLN